MKAIRRPLTANKKREYLTYALFLLWPTLQFIVFYIVVNSNSILLAFQQYNPLTNSYSIADKPFANLGKAFTDLFTGKAGEAHNGMELKYSILLYCSSVFISIPLGLMFSYYIYKKLPASGFYRIILFLPSIVSAIVTTALFRVFVNLTVPNLLYEMNGDTKLLEMGLLGYEKTAFWTVLFYNVWAGFGANILMYSNKMSTIDPELIEAANIDGASGIKEFWHVVLPQVYPTLVIFIISGFANIFLAQYNLFSLYPSYNNVQVSTFGLWFFVHSQRGASGDVYELGQYPYYSALGLVIALFIIPLTFGLKRLLNKLGPSNK